MDPRMAWIIVLLSLIAVTACDGALEPGGPHVEITVERTGGPDITPQVATEPGLVRITATIGVNEPCYDFSAAAEIEGDTLVATVMASRRDGFCLQVLALFGYELTITEVPRGSYQLRLVYDRQGPPTFVETVLEIRVDVP